MPRQLAFQGNMPYIVLGAAVTGGSEIIRYARRRAQSEALRVNLRASSFRASPDEQKDCRPG